MTLIHQAAQKKCNIHVLKKWVPIKD